MTDREKSIVMAYTGICMLTGDKFPIFHKYVEEIMGRPIFTHEIGLLEDTIKEKSKADFVKLCKEETERQFDADMEEKIAEWIDREIYDADRWKCSKCGRTIQYRENFCPNCGRKMKGEEE